MEKIRKLFRVDTNYQLIIVNIVFAVTGTLALYLAGDVINLLGIKESEVSSFIFWTFSIFNTVHYRSELLESGKNIFSICATILHLN